MSNSPRRRRGEFFVRGKRESKMGERRRGAMRQNRGLIQPHGARMAGLLLKLKLTVQYML